MSTSSIASDLARIALDSLTAGAPRPAPRPSRAFAHGVVLQLIALLCAAAALGCALLALGIAASPILGSAGALLVVSAVLCAGGFAAFVFERRARRRGAPLPPPGPASGVAADALLAGGSSLFQQRPFLTLAAALLAGALLGWED